MNLDNISKLVIFDIAQHHAVVCILTELQRLVEMLPICDDFPN